MKIESGGEKGLRRVEAAQYITDKFGVPCSPNTLAKYATVGGGPEYELWGPYPIYRPAKLDAWVASKFSKPIISTNQLQGAA